MVKETAVAKRDQKKAVVKWKGGQVTISFHDVKNFICPLATDQETAIFLKICQSLQLNPFAGEVYLIKYTEKDKAATVIAIDSYLKAGETNANFDGYEAGIILKESAGKLENREGAFLLDEERQKLVGGWAKVYRKDRSRPFYLAVNKKECIKYTKDGYPTQFWTEEKQPSMLRKVALKRALVEAFPSLFAGAISNVDVDYEMLPAEVKEVLPEPKGETPEGELPPAYERNGEAYWKLWWVKQKEKGLSEDDVHDILGVASIKTDWTEKGRTLEEADDIINDALEKAKAKETPVESIEGEGFHIQMDFLKESLKAIKWTDETCKTFLISKYKVSPQGTLPEVLQRLTREQAEEFTKEIAEKVTQKAEKPRMI